MRSHCLAPLFPHFLDLIFMPRGRKPTLYVTCTPLELLKRPILHVKSSPTPSKVSHVQTPSLSAALQTLENHKIVALESQTAVDLKLRHHFHAPLSIQLALTVGGGVCLRGAFLVEVICISVCNLHGLRQEVISLRWQSILGSVSNERTHI